jgi:hypothetical protein
MLAAMLFSCRRAPRYGSNGNCYFLFVNLLHDSYRTLQRLPHNSIFVWKAEAANRPLLPVVTGSAHCVLFLVGN